MREFYVVLLTLNCLELQHTYTLEVCIQILLLRISAQQIEWLLA